MSLNHVRLWLFTFSGIGYLFLTHSATGAPPAEGSNPPRYTVHLLGFDDATHTASWGDQRNRVAGVRSDGTSQTGLIGTSRRYSPIGGNAGESAWYFDAVDKSIQQLGLLDAQYFVGVGQGHRSEPYLINDVGQVAGTTSTNSTTSPTQLLGWLFDPTSRTTSRIGYSTLSPPSSRSSDNIWFLQEDGFVAGTSDHTNHGAVHAWVYDPDSDVTRPIGLPTNTNLGPSNGQLLHTLEGVSPANLVVGTSSRPSDTTGYIAGPAVWVYSPQTNLTKRIGLFDAAHTNADGHQQSQFIALNSQGLVAGLSYYRSGFSNPSSAWLYDPGSELTRVIGFASPTSEAGWSDFITELTEQGRAYGISSRGEGRMPWVYDNSSGLTTTLGLITGAHVLPSGATENSIVDHAASGFVLGHAKRGVGDSHPSFNRTPWIYNPNTGATHAAGLTAGHYTTTGGGQRTTAYQINEHGQAIGTSWLFFQGHSGTIVRESAWFFDPQTGATVELAKSLAESRDIIWNGPRYLNNRGQVVGVAENNSGRGDYVWLYDHRIGSVVSDFDVRNSFTVSRVGGANISIRQLTESGLVLGASERNHPIGSDAGLNLWLYDSRSGVTHDLVFAQSAGGEAVTEVLHLADDGTMFGEYSVYNGYAHAGQRYFYWSIEHGFHDLESLIVGDLAALGWADILRGEGFNDKLKFVNDNLLVAHGLRLNGNYLQLALVRVPEPCSAGLLLLAALAINKRRPRIDSLGARPGA
jgi:hypothetical protein